MDEIEKYWKLSEMEERFNSSAGSIRTLASTWILVSLGSIGWLFNSFKIDSWPMPLGLLVVMVSLLATIGISTLWVMDQLVFHRLLNSIFLVGLKMEKDDPELPPIRSMMIKTQEGTGTSKWELLYYMAPIMIFTLLSLIIIIFGTDKLFLANSELFTLDARFVCWVLLLVQLATLLWVFINRKSTKSFAIRAGWFDDERFTKVIANSSYDSIISNYHKNANRKIQPSPKARG